MRLRYFMLTLPLVLLAACGGDSPATPAPAPSAAASTTSSSAAPAAIACTAPATLTEAQTEGPYFTAGSPERSALVETGMAGTRLVLTGFVLNTACEPIAGAKLDFWQADASGKYDNEGYTLRGHQFTDANGAYRLETVIPGLYPGRTEHIHVKLQAPGGPELTSQLYFPDTPQNNEDGIFSPSLLVALSDAADGKLAGFNFVISQ